MRDVGYSETGCEGHTRARAGIGLRLISGLLLLGLPACRQESPGPATLKTIDAIQQLSLAQAARGLPVEVEGYIPVHRGDDIFLCRHQACIALDTSEAGLQLKQDPLVRVRARTSVVADRRILTAVDVKVIGQKDASREEEWTVGLAAVLEGKRDASFVAVRGRVRGAHTIDNTLFFTLATSDRLVPTRVHGWCGHPSISDAEVRVVGVAVAQRDATGHVSGARLVTARCNFVRIVADGPEDLFAGETQTTAQARSVVNRRVLVRGRLRAAAAPARRYSVEDARGVLAFLPVETSAIEDGEPVLVTGYPGDRDGTTVLEDALVQKLPAPKPAPTSGLPTLTTVAQVRGLSADEARRGYPVRLRAVVTYTDSRRTQFFIQDSTAGIYVSAWRHLFDFPAGQLVEVVGRSEPGLFAPIVDRPRVRVLQRAPLPRPEKVSFDDLLAGSLDSKWVEIEGLVRSVRRIGKGLKLEIAGIGIAGRLPVTVPNFDGPAPQYLIDSRVRVRGVCAFDFNNQRQPVGAKIQTPDFSQIKVLEPSPSDPFSIKSTALETIMGFDASRGPQRRVRIRGVVTFHAPGRFAYVQDREHGMMVATEQDIELHPGDVLEALGFPSMGRIAPVLEDSIVRTVGKTAPPPPRRSAPEEVYDGAGDATLVTMRGRVVNSVSSAGEHILSIRDRSFLISAHLQRAGSLPKSWPPVDALVDVTGLCSVQEVKDGRPQSYRLLLRTDGDIALVEAPSWWTRGRVLGALLLVTGGLLLSWLWVAVLQRTIRRQTSVIQTRLAREAALEERYRKLFESANDVVFTLDLEGRITSLNHAGQHLFGLSLEEAIGRSFPALVVPAHAAHARMLLDPDPSRGAVAVRELDATAHDGEVHTLEVSARAVSEESGISGFQAIARDITERKRAEAKIKVLSGLLPTCASCKKIRDDSGNWNQMEVYIRARSEAEFSHGICPECTKVLYPDYASRRGPPDPGVRS